MVKKCWMCRRSEAELKKEKVVEWHDNKMEKQESVSWNNMPYVCNVCLEIICHFVADQDIVYEDTIVGEVRDALKILLEK